MAQFNEVTENRQTRLPEVATYTVPDFLVTILDHKVNGVALNCIQVIVDYLCTWLYDAYNTLYTLKTVIHTHGGDIAHPELVYINRFQDGTPLYDFTPDHSAGVRTVHYRNLLGGAVPPQDFVTLRTNNAAKRVNFYGNVDMDITFLREQNTQYVAVSREADGRFKISEQEVTLTVKEWHVNPNDPPFFHHTLVGQGIPLSLAPPEEILVATPSNALATQFDTGSKDNYWHDVLQHDFSLIIATLRRFQALGRECFDATNRNVLSVQGNTIKIRNQSVFVNGHPLTLEQIHPRIFGRFVLVQNYTLKDQGIGYRLTILTNQGQQNYIIDPARTQQVNNLGVDGLPNGQYSHAFVAEAQFQYEMPDEADADAVV
jgi:hypothetical protein